MMPQTPQIFVGSATLRIAGAPCVHCFDAVAEAIREVSGVRSVAVDFAERTLTVFADGEVDRADVVAAITSSGHQPTPLH